VRNDSRTPHCDRGPAHPASYGPHFGKQDRRPSPTHSTRARGERGGRREDAVLAKAKEVKKYLEPSLTMSFGIAAVPDTVFFD